MAWNFRKSGKNSPFIQLAAAVLLIIGGIGCLTQGSVPGGLCGIVVGAALIYHVISAKMKK